MIGTMAPCAKQSNEFVVQAIVRRPPDFFTRHGIVFRRDSDDLNDYVVAELSLDGDLPFALMRHEGTPPDETEVYLPDDILPHDVPRVLRRILKELGLSASDLKWQRQTQATQS